MKPSKLCMNKTMNARGGAVRRIICGRSSGYHGVFAPNHRLGDQNTAARCSRRKSETTVVPMLTRHVSTTWAQRWNRLFKINIQTCEHLWWCGQGDRAH
jgi:hypothetical protein